MGKRNFRKHLHHSEEVPADEAVRRLSSLLGRSTEDCAGLLVAGGPDDVPPPTAILTEPKKYRADDLAKWANKYRAKLASGRCA
jgi:hypothetical protein